MIYAPEPQNISITYRKKSMQRISKNLKISKKSVNTLIELKVNIRRIKVNYIRFLLSWVQKE